ncbi:hypothetical protein J132_07644 [Termitomyces sp. J132]|nr:hypothetical protein J132_07644 [Termitomyces sp. J132]
MSPSTEVLFQQLYNTENSVLVSAIRGDLSDLQGRVKQLKSLWKQISQAKDKQLVLEARKSFFNEALKILSGKLSDAKTIEELEEKAGAYFKESQARKAAQEVNKGQAGGGVAAIDPLMIAVDLVIPAGLVSTAALPSSAALVSPVGLSSKPGRVLVSSPLSPAEPVPAQPWVIKKASEAQIPQWEWRKYTAQTLPHSPPPPSQSEYQSITLDKDNKNDSNDDNNHSDDEECWQGEITPPMSLTKDHKEEVWRNKGKKGKKEKRQRKPKSAEYVKVGLNQWLNFINEGIEVVLEEMRLWFVLAEETRFTEMEKMLQQYNTMLQVLDECMDIIDMSVVGMASNLNRTKQTVEAHAGCLIQNEVDIVALWGISPSTSSLPPVLASTLAPIAEAQEPNDNKAVQPKENESKMDCATTVAIAIDQSTIADNSALVSDPVAIVTDSIISSRSATKSVACTGPAASITDSAIATDSIRTGSQ